MKKENYTTADMNGCVYDSVDDWGKEINKYLGYLKKIISIEKHGNMHRRFGNSSTCNNDSKQIHFAE